MNKTFLNLKKIMNNAYAPYSKFMVAACVETEKGTFFGVNVENAAYPSGICAERNAIFNAVTNGSKQIKRLDLISSSEREDVIPCAACLQVMTEFISKDTKIGVYSKGGKYVEYKFIDLLPKYFSKGNLK